MTIHELVNIITAQAPTYWHIYKGYVIILSVLFILKWLALRFYKRRKSGILPNNLAMGVNNSYWVMVVIVLFFLVLRLFGITIREFFTSIAIVAAALAIVFRDYILNGLNGMVLIIGDNLNVGDYVKIGSHKGMVGNITLVAVHLMNDDQDLVLLPNNFVMASEIVNYTKNPHHKFSLEFTLPIGRAMNTQELALNIAQSVNRDEILIRPKQYSVVVNRSEEKFIVYSFQYILILNTMANQIKVKNRVWNAIINYLQH